MAEVARHVDAGKWLASFSDEVLVVCSRCETSGTVRAQWAPYCWTGAFVCDNCELSLSTGVRDWVGPVVVQGRRACGHCGHKWLRVSDELERRPAVMGLDRTATCTECAHASPVSVEVVRAPIRGQAIDPHFGLPLRLVVSTRHGPVWAYNVRHLNELRGYVGATLRSRRGTANASIFSRMPKWMKVAKHRDEMLKAFDRLEQMRVRVQTPSAAA